MQKYIKIRGAREHNLKNVNIDIPKDSLVVITGVSGSGKSSLAFDTIYADGQRRYVESLSAYARQFLDIQKKPSVDSIEGLAPAISIEQKTTSKNPRSTVGTVTEIYDYMRLLWARVGVPYSPETGLPIESQTVGDMVDGVFKSFDDGDRILILAPVVRAQKGEHRKEFLQWQKAGFTRFRVNGEIYDLDGTVLNLDKNKRHIIEVIVDRLVVKSDDKYPNLKEVFNSRLYESLETALRLTEGLVIVENADTKNQTIFSENFACPISGFAIEALEPRLFSFNAPQGACDACAGLGMEFTFSADLVVPDDSLSIRQGAIKPWSSADGTINPWYEEGIIIALEEEFGKGDKYLNMPWIKLPTEIKEYILHSKRIELKEKNRRWSQKIGFEGVVENLKRLYKETSSNARRESFEKYLQETDCPKCKGKRLNEQALSVKIDKKDIMEATEFSIEDALDWFGGLNNKFSPKNREISSRILKEIIDRLHFLNNVGLGYLNLSRKAGTLSGGEAQRIRLASQIGSGLTGVLYVLDEPSIGLHQRDNDKLIATLHKLKNQDNSIIVVEHDEDTMREADFVIDMGIGAGVHGGEIIAAGTLDEVLKSEKSLTAQYLTGKRKIWLPKKRRKGNGSFIEVKGCSHNNLQNIDVKIPLGCLVGITGVSGSGKSSMIIDTVYPALMKNIYKSKIQGGKYKSIKGLENLDKVVDINQSPIGRTPRSNPATYTGVFSNIRDWFAGLPLAKQKGYKSGRFSFNVKGGRCEACSGDGVKKIEMHFLPDVYVQCDVCNGSRYNAETLLVKYREKSIADVLAMPVEEAMLFFEKVPAIRNKLQYLYEVGLGYITLGQSATTLSGGEAQRVKLAKELSKKATGRTIYILDEPTTGLHFADVHKLLEVLHRLVASGNSVLVIEHNLEVIKTADWIIDIGPEGGKGGGQIIAKGTPEDVVKVEGSYTGKYLKKLL